MAFVIKTSCHNVKVQLKQNLKWSKKLVDSCVNINHVYRYLQYVFMVFTVIINYPKGVKLIE